MEEREKQKRDVARSMALLWGRHKEKGRGGLSVKTIVDSAIELADTEGIEALSMRNVAKKLGVGTMSLYTHVPGKADLIDLMCDHVQEEVYRTTEIPQGDWRIALRVVAQQNYSLYLRHPWLLTIAADRSILGPHTLIKYEKELQPLNAIGLTDVEMDAALSLILSHVQSCARQSILLEQIRQESGESDEEWWVRRAPLLEMFVEDNRFPIASRVGRASSEAYAGVSSPDFSLNFGLERIIAGIASLIEDHRSLS